MEFQAKGRDKKTKNYNFNETDNFKKKKEKTEDKNVSLPTTRISKIKKLLYIHQHG